MKTPRTLIALLTILLLAVPASVLADTEEPDAAPVETPAETPISAPEGDADFASALEGASGLRVETMCTNCNVATVTMCGQTDERVQVWKDGLPVMGGLGAIYLLSIMPSDGIESTEIIRGAGTVLSGSEAGAGAVNIKTSTPARDGLFSAAVDFGGLDWSSQKVFATGKTGRWGGELAFTHAQAAEGSDPNSDGNNEIGAFDRLTAGATGTFDLSKRSRIRVDALGYKEDQWDVKGAFENFEGDRSVFAREDIEIQRREFGLGWDHRFRNGSRLMVRGRYSKRDQDSSDDSTLHFLQPYMLIDEYAKLATAQYETILFQKHILTAGLVYRDFEVDALIDADDNLIVNDFVEHRGAYAQVDFSLPKSLSLTAGVRADEFDWTTGERTNINPAFVSDGERIRSRVSPRLRLGWKPVKTLALTLSAGYGFSPPRPVAERVCCGLEPTSNSVSEAEVSRNFLLDADWVPYPWLKLRGSLFRNDFEDFLQKMAVFAIPPYHPTTSMLNYGDFALQGAEISTEMRFRNGFSWGLDWTHLETESDGPITVFLAGNEFYDLPEGQIPMHPEDQGSTFVRWEDKDLGFEVEARAQYTGSMLVQTVPFFGFATEFRDTRSFWVYNFRVEKSINRGLSAFAGVDNISDEYQDWLDDPANEYQWGPLRGRYVFAGISLEI